MQSGKVKRQEIIKDTSMFSGSTYIAQGMSFIRGFLNARMLAPALYGLWSGLNIILDYSAYVHIGALNGMNIDIPYQKGMGSENNIDKARNSAFTVCLINSLIFSFVLVVVSIFLWRGNKISESIGLITIAILNLTTSMYDFYATSLIALKRFFSISKANTFFAFLSVCLTLILVPLFKIYGVYITAVVVSAATFLYLFIKEPCCLKLDFDFRYMYKLIKIGFPVMSVNLLNSTIPNMASVSVIFLLGRESLGYYAVAMMAAYFLSYFPNSIHRIFEPHIYQKYGETRDLADLKKYLLKPALVMAMLFPVIMALYYVSVTFFIRHFLPKYEPSIGIFSIIILARFFVSFSPTSNAFINAMNKQKFLIPIYLMSIAIVAVSSFIFIKSGFGVNSVAIGLLASFFFMGSVIFIYAIGHYIKPIFRRIIYLGGLYLPLAYIAAIVFFNERLMPSSTAIFSDAIRMCVKLAVLCVFSMPLIYIANLKTGIITDLMIFFKKGNLRYETGDIGPLSDRS
jgi:O-antigen/teichoic acid export membrane protein